MAKNKPTEKQIKYLAEKMKGAPTKKEAALRAGYSKETADNVQAQIESRVGYQSLKEMLDNADIKAKMSAVLEQGMDAMKPVVVDGVINDYPDYNVRRQYVDTITDITGDKAKKEIDVTNSGDPLQIIFTNGDK